MKSASKTIRSVLSLLLAFCLCFGMVANLPTAMVSANTITAWDGTKTTDFTEADIQGAGTEGDPYKITNGTQLYAVIASNGAEGAYYKLTNDIYLNADYANYSNWTKDTTGLNDWSLTGLNEWGTGSGEGREFKGNIDGAGHTIYGLYRGGSSDYVGLIVANTGATTIKNLNISNSFVSGNTGGILIASTAASGLSVENCTVTNSKFNITSTGDKSRNTVGTFVGRAMKTTKINNCAVSDVVFTCSNESAATATFATVGSIAGGSYCNFGEDISSWASNLQITNSYAVNVVFDVDGNAKDGVKLYPVSLAREDNNFAWGAGAKNVYTDAVITDVPSYTYDGGTADDTSDDITYTLQIADVSDTATVIAPTSADYPIKQLSSADAIKGAAAITAMPLLDWEDYWTAVDGGYPYPEDKTAGKYWDGTKTTDITTVGMEGTGSEDDPYIITNGTQLYAAIYSGGSGAYYKLDKDIYLNKDYKNYTYWATANSENITLSNSNLNDWIDNISGAQWEDKGVNRDFHGTIDGAGHTIYGLYAAGWNNCALIPSVDNSKTVGADGDIVTVKNLKISHSYVYGGESGFIVGGQGTNGKGSITIENCTVLNSKATTAESGNGMLGGIIGRASRNVVIKNSAVYDVVMVAPEATDYAKYRSGYGAIVGAVYNYGHNSSDWNQSQSNSLAVIDCYSVNVTFSGTTDKVYPIGIGYNRWDKCTYAYCVTAENVYSDATTIPTAISNNATEDDETDDFIVRLLVTDMGGTAAIAPTAANYPIKTVSADAIKGEAAKTAMPRLNFDDSWTAVENDYPFPEDKKAGKGWDGTKTTDFTEAGILGTGTEEDPYIIKNGTQLYAAIYSGGNGAYYKFANNIYLNDDYLNYASWTTTNSENTTMTNASLNDWTDNTTGITGTWADKGEGKDFSGTIDGAGYTVYGLYAAGWSHAGLIPSVDETDNGEDAEGDIVVVKNLNISHSHVYGANSGFIVGGQGTKNGGSVTINNCTVSNSMLRNHTEAATGMIGGFIGKVGSGVTISNCAIYDVVMEGSEKTDNYRYRSGYGSMVGGLYNHANTLENVWYAEQANCVKVSNSFAFNVTFSGTTDKVYPIGIGLNRWNNYEYGYCATVDNVYTDATAIPTAISNNATADDAEDDFTVTLLVTTPGGTEAIDPSADDYPIKTITSEAAMGNNALMAMPLLSECEWKTTPDGYPEALLEYTHDEQIMPEEPAHCETSGLTEGLKCNECGKIFIAQQPITAPGHTEVPIGTLTPATTTADGITAGIKCDVCGDPIEPQRTIAKIASISLSETSYTYDGKVKKPAVVVKDSLENTLVEGIDYDVVYASGRKNAGTYKVTVNFKNNYAGTEELSFKINPIDISKCSVKLATTSYTYDGKVKSPSVVVKNAGGTKLTKGTHYTVTYAKGRKNAGTYKVTVKMTGNYTGTKTLSFKINPINISKCSVKLKTTEYTYSGSVKAPTVVVKNAGGTTLKKGTHYTVTYAKGRKNVGKYKVTVKMTGNYSGTKTLYFTINPKKTSVSKLTAGTKSIKVTIKKQSPQVSGYQIQYSTSAKFTNAKTKTVSGYNTTSYTIKSLTKNKTYYVRVRTYKTVNGKKYYSGWSTYKYTKAK